MNAWVKPVIIIFLFAFAVPYIAQKFKPLKPGKDEEYAPKNQKKPRSLPKVYLNPDYESRDVRAMRYRLRKKQEQSENATKNREK